MAYSPSSKVYLLSTPLDLNLNNQFDFSTKTAQYNYFNSLKKSTVSSGDYTFIKKDNVLRVTYNIDDLYDVNYCMYQNTSYGDKWFYCFIKDMKYINDNCTELYIETDAWQTWQFDIQIMDSFVEREHVNNDAIGENLIDEGLATGEYVTNVVGGKNFNDWWICVGSTVELKPDGSGQPATGYVYGGIYSGVNWYCFDVETAENMLYAIIQDPNIIDGIVSIFMIPKDVVSEEQNNGGYLQSELRSPGVVALPTSKSLDGYTPRNNKLLTYPYRAIMVTNNNGDAVTLKFENFDSDAEPRINYIGGIQPNSTIVAYPVNYLREPRNMSYSVALSGYPQCAWTKDVYAQWLASQSIRNSYTEERFMRNTLTNLSTGALTTAITGNPLGALSLATSGINAVNNQLDMYSKMAEEKEVHSMIPPSVRGTIANGSTNVSIGKFGFQVLNKSIRKEYAKAIDDYFDMYGYKVNRVKKPNIRGRLNWNYVKTIGVNIKGTLPIGDKQKIMAMFDNGVTFWHNPSNFCNYSLSNNIV